MNTVLKGIICLTVILSFLSIQAQTVKKTNTQKRLILRNVSLIDVEAKTIHKEMDIVISDKKITAIGQKVKYEEKDSVVDLTGKFVIPGIIDAHTHLTTFKSREDLKKDLAYLLRHGITSVRDVGSDARQLAEIKRAIDAKEAIGPDIYYSAFMATRDYFTHGQQKSWMVGLKDQEFAPWVQLVNPGDNLDIVMATAKATGATGIKIYMGYDKSYLKNLAEAAKKFNLEVWGHAMQFPAKPTEVALSGMKVLSHAYMLEWEGLTDPGKNVNVSLSRYNSIDFKNVNIDPFIEAALTNNIIMDATLWISEKAGTYPHAIEFTKKLYKSGIKISAGTDWPVDTKEPHPTIYDELQVLIDKCGFTPIDALRSATLIAAETFGGVSKKGSIAIGKDADIVILEANPLENIRNYQSIKMVIKNGDVIIPDSVKKY